MVRTCENCGIKLRNRKWKTKCQTCYVVKMMSYERAYLQDLPASDPPVNSFTADFGVGKVNDPIDND